MGHSVKRNFVARQNSKGIIINDSTNRYIGSGQPRKFKTKFCYSLRVNEPL